MHSQPPPPLTVHHISIRSVPVRTICRPAAPPGRTVGFLASMHPYPPPLLFTPHVLAYHSQAITTQMIRAWRIWVLAQMHSQPPPASATHFAVVHAIICQAISRGCSVPVQCLAHHCPGLKTEMMLQGCCRDINVCIREVAIKKGMPFFSIFPASQVHTCTVQYVAWLHVHAAYPRGFAHKHCNAVVFCCLLDCLLWLSQVHHDKWMLLAQTNMDWMVWVVAEMTIRLNERFAKLSHLIALV